MIVSWAGGVSALGLYCFFGRSMRPRGTPVFALFLFVITGTTGQSTSGAPAELCGHTWEAIDDEKHVYYKINVCVNLNASDCGGVESAICAHDINQNTFQSVGTLPLQKGNNVLVFNTTADCPGSNHKIQSIINLICGKSLGTPEFVKYDECVHYFEWSTFTACKKNLFKPIKEVPCYIFDSDYKKHDLNPLIKTSGAYAVDDWDTESDLYINICRTIDTSEGDTAKCPKESSACLIKNGVAYDVGQPKDALTSLVKERLVVHYETENKPDFCNGHSPAVTITFICPSAGTEVTSPKLTANTNCRYEVEWVTENACHTDYLESSNCVLNSKERGISIDLTPLKEKPGSPYHAEDPENRYIYYLNVCGSTVAGECTGEKVSSCQFIKSSNLGKTAGSYQDQTLRYSDGTITLTYPGGETCSSGFQRMTVINFECDDTAENDGKGVPVFSAEADCTYFFSWNTKYACPKKKEDLCHVEARKKHFNLFDLIRSPESSTAQNWEAVNTKQSDESRFYVNVCHGVLQTGEAVGCEEDAAICAVDSGVKKNLGKFLTPPKMVNGNILLQYTEGSTCAEHKQIETSITLLCSPGNRESPPVLKHADECLYEFEWHTAAACVLSKTEGDDCRVSDLQAGFYFDLSPLTKKSGSYNVVTDMYEFYINVCGNVTQDLCETNSGACQVTKTKSDHWNIGLGNSKLSYYDGMLQLSYTDGTPYNDEKKTPRSSLITFLCDRNIDVGQPEYQKEDNYTYNFKWHTKYACPGLPVECVVVDSVTKEQYDLSSLSKVQGEHSSNWFATEGSSKYYINVCRSLVPVIGCDPFAAVCQMDYNKDSDMPVETIAIDNLGMASSKPIIDKSGQIIIEYTNGSECINLDGKKTTYSSVVHLACKKGSMSASPIFISKQNCNATFMWYTEAACPIVKEVHGKGDCSVENPNTGFVYHFESLKNDSGYIVQGNGKTYKLNICGPVKECGLIGDIQTAGCEFENNIASRPVQLSQTLDLSTEGLITLIYRGALQEATGQGDTFTINFVCNDDLYPGELSFKKEEINSELHLYDTFFDFETAMACAPAPVDCQVTDSAGNFYDLSDLTLDNESWTAVDSSNKSKERTFYLNICKPVPYTHRCKGNAVGSCMKTSDNKSINLGVIQMSPQVQEDGSLTIVYMSGDKCTDKKRYSTRINFQCDHVLGSPVFQEQDGCEYVFLWRTSEACPVVRAEGDNCQVRDPKYGYLYNLKPLGEKPVEVLDGGYTYQLKVCGELSESPCASQAPTGETVSSCQVTGNTGKVAGLTNQKLIYKDGLLMLNYTGGELCHKKYKRTTLIMFHCDKTEGKPVFLKETPDCTYMFQWRTPHACPFKPVDCSFKDTLGNSYDLSPLANYSGNWEVQPFSGSNKKYWINICMPLVPETASCPYGAAACLIEGTKAVNLGELASSPKWENKVAVLQYKNGDRCPDGLRNRSTTIHFDCDLNRVDSIPILIAETENCDYTLLWTTASACPLTVNTQDDCRVTNPATGYLFDLLSLSSKDGYVVKDRERSIQLNVCSDFKNTVCDTGVGVCVTEGGKHINAGMSQSRLTYSDQVITLEYKDGDKCSNNPFLKHHSIFTFVCGADGQPVLRSFNKETCMWQFSWHTSLVCEQKIKCSVQNGTSIIDLSPLMKRFGNYEVLQGTQKDDSSDFYINICKPLNYDVDVRCPPGAAACRLTASGQPIDIGHSTGAPQIDRERQTISIKMDSPMPCDSDKQSNYSTIIMFHCKMGTDLGRPKFVQRSECSYLFEWDTPLVCPDDETVSGCLLTDQQLQYTFNLTSLSVETHKTSDLNPYYIGVCSPAQNVPIGKCDGAVCFPSGNTAFSFGNAKQMKMEYRHQEDMIVLQYAGGDSCPQANDSRQSTILFKCDEGAGKGTPGLLSETRGCSATFEWKTQLACLPRKLDCRFIMHHKTYDLRMLSSMTGSWHFTNNGNKYYLNLCQRVNQGPNACSESASVCQENNGHVHVLGQVHTQTVTVKDDVVSVTYSNGDPCGNDKRYSTTIELKCANITGKPILQRFDSQSCHYFIAWETRAACAVDPKEASMTNGIVHVQNGGSLNLTSIYIKSYNASGDIRLKDQYVYQIRLSGKEDSAYQKCNGASVCQVKTNGDFSRAVGTSGKAKYYLDDDDLDVVFSSNSKCGKDPTKNATSTIVFHCSQTQGEGRPEFLHETADCQYLFSWHTSAVCSYESEATGNNDDGPDDNQKQYQGLSGRSQALGAILSILLVILVVCLIVLLLYKKERRETVIYKITNCCRRSSNVSYKYTKINTEEEVDNETEWLMEEVSANHAKPHHENGHVRSVKAEAFTSLHVDDLDSEDEVLTIPEVRIQSARNKQRNANQAVSQYASSNDENLIGIVNGGQEKTGKLRFAQHKKEDEMNIVSFHDDSDEDMLNI